MDPKPLIEQSLWWLLPGALFSLFMVHAMVMFTAALLTKRPRARNQPLTADELRARLLELNDDRRLMAKLAPGRDCDFTLDCKPVKAPGNDWTPTSSLTPTSPGRRRGLPLCCQPVHASWYELYSHVKFTTHYRARLLLDEATREARWNELMRGSNFFLGFDGWIPRFQMSFWFFMGIASVN